MELVPDAIVIADRHGRIVGLNRFAERLSGYAEADLVGQLLEVLVPVGSRDQHEILRSEFIRDPQSRPMGSGIPLRLLRKDGTELPVDISLQPWNSEQGQFIFSAIRDVSAQQQREDALRASEERFALAVRGSTDGIWDWNVITNEVYYSPRFKELLGCEEHEMENVFSAFESRLAPEDVNRVHQALRDHFARQIPYDIEYRLRTKSGEYRWFWARGQAIWDDKGNPTRMAGSISDITEQKRSQQRFEMAVFASPVALLIIDRSGKIRLVNEQLERCFDYKSTDLLDQSIEMLVPERDRPRHAALREQYFQNPISRTIGAERELYARRRDGSEFPVEIGLSPLETDEEMLVICGIADVTHRQQALVAMQAAKEAAEAANRAKSDFLANMSHEIRTPLNAVIGMTELVLDTDLSQLQRDYLKMVMEAGDLLLSIINEILDFSKIEAGRIELEWSAFHVRDVVGDTVRALAPRAHHKNLELAYEIAPTVPDLLWGDANRFRQILLNLVGNAIKFTNTGEILARIGAVSESSDRVLLRCSITDTGIGIAKDKQTLIFEAFSQSDSSTTRLYGGTGLGLTICAKLVELMGGKMTVKSELGKGSTFSFTARFGSTSPTAEMTQPPDLEALRDLPVLIVDDNATNRRILRETLHHWQMAPVDVPSAAEAIDQLQQYQAAGRPFRLVLTDVNMPAVDGWTLCNKIREMPQLKQPILILLTSGDRAGNLELGRSLDIEAYLLKPVKPSELLGIVLRILGRAMVDKEPRAPQSQVSQDKFKRSLHVLLVEDSLMNQQLAAGLLTNWGHTVTIVDNGTAAIEACEQQTFDLILMNTRLPDISGLEATAVIRQREAFAGTHVPIIAISAHAPGVPSNEHELPGMDTQISKPVRHRDLLLAIQSCCPEALMD